MDEDQAHALYNDFSAVDAGARFKQGIGFAGRGVKARLPGGYNEDQDDDDVIAKNRRIRAALYGGSLEERDERDDGYDSDTAAAVQRRLAQLKREHKGARQGDAVQLPEKLYDERLEQKQLRQQRQQQRSRSRSPGRSRSRSRDRQGRQHRSRSRERRRYRSRSRHRRDEHRRHHRSRSRDRQPNGTDRRCHSRSQGREGRRRSRSREQRRHNERGGSHGGRSTAAPAGKGNGGTAASAGTAGLQRYDFEALIPGYCDMNVAQRLRAKTQYLLERSTAQDQRRERSRQEGEEGGGQPWTRFRFDASAELEEHRATPETGAMGGVGSEGDEEDETEARLLAGLNSVTFRQSNAAAVQQERDDSHAAAIFGGDPTAAARRVPTAGMGGSRLPERVGRQVRGSGGTATAARAASPGPLAAAVAARGTGAGLDLPTLLAQAEAEGAVVVPAEQVAASMQLQQQTAGGASGSVGPSWRERALAAKCAKQQQAQH